MTVTLAAQIRAGRVLAPDDRPRNPRAKRPITELSGSEFLAAVRDVRARVDDLNTNVPMDMGNLQVDQYANIFDPPDAPADPGLRVNFDAPGLAALDLPRYVIPATSESTSTPVDMANPQTVAFAEFCAWREVRRSASNSESASEFRSWRDQLDSSVTNPVTNPVPTRVNPPRDARDPTRVIHYGKPDATDEVSRELERIRAQHESLVSVSVAAPLRSVAAPAPSVPQPATPVVPQPAVTIIDLTADDVDPFGVPLPSTVVPTVVPTVTVAVVATVVPTVAPISTIPDGEYINLPTGSALCQDCLWTCSAGDSPRCDECLAIFLAL